MNRFHLLGLPLDFPTDADIADFVIRGDKERNRQVCFVTLEDFNRARKGGEYGSMIASADLVIPLSPSLVRAAAAAGAQGARCPDSLRTVIALLSALESQSGSVYMVGSKPAVLSKAESNLKSTFPGLRVVGRHAGPWTQENARATFEAIRKSTPGMILAGSGLPGGELWVSRSMPEFRAGIFVWERRLFETLSGESRTPAARGRDVSRPVQEFISHPTAPLRVFPLISLAFARAHKRRQPL